MNETEMLTAVKQLQTLAEQRKLIEEAEEEIRKQLKSSLEAEHTEEVNLPGGHKVSWKEVFSNRIDSKKLKAEMPDLYNKYLSVNVTRRFTIA